MRELTPHRTSCVASFSPLTQESLDQEFGGLPFHSTIGFVYDSGQRCFIGKGCASEVLNIRSGKREGAWSYKNAVVACACVFNDQIVVGLKFNVDHVTGYGGLICLYDPGICKVVKAIGLAYAPVAMCVIRKQGGASAPPTLVW